MKKRWMTGWLILLVCFCAIVAAGAEGFPKGDWAFNHAPEESVLLVREDGTAVFQGKEYTWETEEEFLHLTDAEGTKTSLRYRTEDGKTLLYLPAEYRRAEDVPGEGLLGAWIGKESEGSNYIFRGDGMFLEDGTFTGTYQIDAEAGTVLLHYIRYFDDTLVYFRVEGNDTLKVEYPWPLVERQETP